MKKIRESTLTLIFLIIASILVIYFNPQPIGLVIYSGENLQKYQNVVQDWNFSDGDLYIYNSSEIIINNNQVSLKPKISNHSWYETVYGEYSLLSALYNNFNGTSSVALKDDITIHVDKNKTFDIKFNGSIENNDTIEIYIKSGLSSEFYLCDATIECPSPGYGNVSYNGEEGWYNITVVGLAIPEDTFNLDSDSAEIDFIKAVRTMRNEISSANNTYSLQSTIQTKDVITIKQIRSFTILDELNNQSIGYKYSSDSGATWNAIPGNISTLAAGKIRFSATLFSNTTETPVLKSMILVYDKTPPNTYFEIADSALVNVTSIEPVTINSSKYLLKISTISDVNNVNISITEFTGILPEILKPIKTPIEITIDSTLKNNLKSAVASIDYTDEDIVSKSIGESTIKFYYYNETNNTWTPLESDVDTTNNVVRAVLPHFSIYGVFGNEIITVLTNQTQVNETAALQTSSETQAAEAPAETANQESQNEIEEKLFEEEILTKERLSKKEKGITGLIGFTTNLGDIGLGNIIVIILATSLIAFYFVHKIHKRGKQPPLTDFMK